MSRLLALGQERRDQAATLRRSSPYGHLNWGEREQHCSGPVCLAWSQNRTKMLSALAYIKAS
jgi:hypothetical protein